LNHYHHHNHNTLAGAAEAGSPVGVAPTDLERYHTSSKNFKV